MEKKKIYRKATMEVVSVESENMLASSAGGGVASFARASYSGTGTSLAWD